MITILLMNETTKNYTIFLRINNYMKSFKQYIKEAVVTDPNDCYATLGGKVVKLEYSLDYGTQSSNEQFNGVPLVDGCTIYLDNGENIFTHSRFFDDEKQVFELIKKGELKIKEDKGYYKQTKSSMMKVSQHEGAYTSKRGTLTIKYDGNKNEKI